MNPTYVILGLISTIRLRQINMNFCNTELSRCNISSLNLSSDTPNIGFVFYDNKIICLNGSPLEISYNLLSRLPNCKITILGQSHNCTLFFCLSINTLSDIEVFTVDTNLISLKSLRELTPQINTHLSSLLSYASHLLYWQSKFKYCPSCKARLKHQLNGHMLYCIHCNTENYPRINPAVITSIHYQDKLFLARQETWDINKLSVIAGFVEPGESLEQATIREVKEETNIDIAKVEYFSSQPWSFSSSIMIAYKSTALSQDYNIDNDELCEGYWFTPEEYILKLKSKEIAMPSSLSISASLIQSWIFEQTGQTINELIHE